MNNKHISFFRMHPTAIAIGLLVTTIAATSCKTMAPQTMPAVKPLPAQYPGADTLTQADTLQLSFDQFFKDRNLQAFIDSAMRNNTDLQIALQRIIKAEARLMARKGALGPNVSAVISGSADKYGDYTLNGVGNFDTNLSPNISKDQKIPVSPTTDMFVGLRSDWEIDIWGKLKSLRKAALAEALATREARQFIVTNLIAELTEKYYQLLSLDTELGIVQKNIRLQEQALDIVKAQKEGGRANELAVQQFAAQLLNTRSIAYTLQQDRVETENEMNALAGHYPQYIKRDTSLFEVPDNIPLFTGVPVALLSNRPDIRQIELELLAASENVKAARKSFLPSLVISPYLAFNAFTPALLFRGGSSAFGLLGGLSTPLLQQKKLRADYTIANAENRETVFRYQQILLDAYSEVTTNMSAVKNHQLTYNLKKKEVKQLQEAVTTSHELYQSGYASYLEVITAQKNRLDAELEMVRKKKDIYSAAVHLYRALGGGWKNSATP
ncbi:TolC family protein [Terrimonas sp. NA20]|uniref:TolC family protein n=1 Tax=Terrimonas ginsenosidimutans TaxID=2908004 RepID=A0ABS9KTS5_9BACT|nr:TolC family protein [Terrimonas ginsenosidimutans]MCG2615742.1 TolC family protein [Terrimonas ginsenosidimutans]